MPPTRQFGFFGRFPHLSRTHFRKKFSEILNPFLLRALRVIEIFKFLRAISPAGQIFVLWAHYERANEKCLKFDTFLAVT